MNIVSELLLSLSVGIFCYLVYAMIKPERF